MSGQSSQGWTRRQFLRGLLNWSLLAGLWPLAWGAEFALASPGLSAPPPGLDLEEWRVIGLVMNEILPGTATMPSATQAGVMIYLARAMRNQLPGWRLVSKPPFVRRENQGGGYARLLGHYRMAVMRLSALSQDSFGKAYAALSPAERAEITRRFSESAKVDVGYRIAGVSEASRASNSELFQLLRRHAIEGYFSDPRHGGNTDFEAWRAIGHTHHWNYQPSHSHHS